MNVERMVLAVHLDRKGREVIVERPESLDLQASPVRTLWERRQKVRQDLLDRPAHQVHRVQMELLE